MFDGINLSNEAHSCETRRALGMFVALLPIGFSAELGSLTEVASGVRVNGVFARSALGEGNLVFAESFHGRRVATPNSLLKNPDFRKVFQPGSSRAKFWRRSFSFGA